MLLVATAGTAIAQGPAPAQSSPAFDRHVLTVAPGASAIVHLFGDYPRDH